MSNEAVAPQPENIPAFHQDVLRLFSETAVLHDLFANYSPEFGGHGHLTGKGVTEEKDCALTRCNPQRADQFLELIRRMHVLAESIAQRNSLFFWFTRAFCSVDIRGADFWYGCPIENDEASYHERAFSIACECLRELPAGNQIRQLPDKLVSSLLKSCLQSTDADIHSSMGDSNNAKYMQQALRLEGALAAKLSEKALVESVRHVPRIVVSIDPPQVIIDKVCHTITPDQAVCLKLVVAAKGQWISGTVIREKTAVAKPDRVLRNLRKQLVRIDFIESATGKGFRIKEEWLA